MVRGIGIVLVVGILAGCGVPRGAVGLAGEEVAGMSALPADGDDAGVRRALAGQADAWGLMEGMVRRRVVGGIAVGEDFVALVERTAALARRVRGLIEAGADDPAMNREALEKMRGLWGEVAAYLSE